MRGSRSSGTSWSLWQAARSSGSRIVLLTAPSREYTSQWAVAAFVPDHSGGTAVDLHHLPFTRMPGFKAEKNQKMLTWSEANRRMYSDWGQDMDSHVLERAAEALARSRSVLVVTGAGVSAESGIPTFRGDGGLWEGFRAEELATPEAFAEDPHRVWRWYRWRRRICLRAEPNPAHLAIAEMESSFDDFQLATQNVDGLHRRAGSRNIVELHGCINRTRCTGCEEVRDLTDEVEPDDAPLPECKSCGKMLRPHIVWFGESYQPGILEAATAAAEQAEFALVAGTSAQIWPPIAVALHAKRTGAFLVDVNPDTTSVSVQADAHLAGPAGEVLPALWEMARKMR